MKSIIILILLFALCISAYSQTSATGESGRFQSVGGDFAKSWLKENVAQEQPAAQSKTAKPESLWDWGSTPKGKILKNGKLVDDNSSLKINTSFAWLSATQGLQNSPLVLNSSGLSTLNGSALRIPSLALSDDPWVLAQQLERPIYANQVNYPTK